MKLVSKRKDHERAVPPLSYWAPSAGNLLSSLVWSLGADLRVHADAIRVLKLISGSSREEIADLIGEGSNGSYRAMQAEAFAGIRAEAIETVKRSIAASQAPNVAAAR